MSEFSRAQRTCLVRTSLEHAEGIIGDEVKASYFINNNHASKRERLRQAGDLVTATTVDLSMRKRFMSIFLTEAWPVALWKTMLESATT